MADAHSSGETTADIVIVGGGMAGLTAALAFGTAGLSVVLVDRSPVRAVLDAAFDGRTAALALGSQRVLDGLDAWEGMAADAEPIREIRVSDGGSPLFLHYDHREVGDEPLGYIVENRHIRRALHERLAACPSVRLIAPASVADLAREGSFAQARLEDGRIVQARLAVAADGRDSPLRQAAGIPVTAWAYPQTGIVCTVRHEKPHRGIAHERFLPAGPLAMLPMRGNLSSVVWTERRERAPHLMGLDEAAFAAEIAHRFGPSLGALEVVGGRWSYPLALCHADRYAAPRLALVGDAAHAIHPIAGQGFNLGLRDVAALAETVVDTARLGLDFGGLETLRAYERWRRFDSVALAAATDILNRLFSNDVAPIRLARDLGLAAVNRAPPLRRVFMRHAMGLVGDLPRLARGEPL
ncbi:MAG: UbiH/UbiF/VisC/COQ6 family ubiquinone biosynthesis hydroxylase [Rhodospirillaceae bacterium]|nr:UbiH/UbiF/VisC/COQ6 family ubiquinone biosynthesis hydroxylase [Rhodospirillaceae bacterium]MBT6117763.1 UbiH/UbiF/VisC/COQ6 family ubiquinone biosynthesis hydroxylase [Rhodospirillaceae bacterium]